MKRCPRCGYNEFATTVHTIQEWIVDEEGNLIKCIDCCAAITNSPNNNAVWVCLKCDYYGFGKEFEVNMDSQQPQAPQSDLKARQV